MSPRALRVISTNRSSFSKRGIEDGGQDRRAAEHKGAPAQKPLSETTDKENTSPSSLEVQENPAPALQGAHQVNVLGAKTAKGFSLSRQPVNTGNGESHSCRRNSDENRFLSSSSLSSLSLLWSSRAAQGVPVAPRTGAKQRRRKRELEKLNTMLKLSRRPAKPPPEPTTEGASGADAIAKAASMTTTKSNFYSGGDSGIDDEAVTPRTLFSGSSSLHSKPPSFATMGTSPSPAKPSAGSGLGTGTAEGGTRRTGRTAPWANQQSVTTVRNDAAANTGSPVTGDPLPTPRRQYNFYEGQDVWVKDGLKGEEYEAKVLPLRDEDIGGSCLNPRVPIRWATNGGKEYVEGWRVRPILSDEEHQDIIYSKTVAGSAPPTKTEDGESHQMAATRRSRRNTRAPDRLGGAQERNKYEKKDIRGLKKILKMRGLSVQGTKSVLADRLVRYDKDKKAATPARKGGRRRNKKAVKAEGNNRKRGNIYEKMTSNDLKALLREKGLSMQGDQARLANRMLRHDMVQLEDGVDVKAPTPGRKKGSIKKNDVGAKIRSTDAGQTKGKDEAGGSAYKGLKMKDLQNLLAARGKDTKGWRKVDLIQRLVDDDLNGGERASAAVVRRPQPAWDMHKMGEPPSFAAEGGGGTASNGELKDQVPVITIFSDDSVISSHNSTSENKDGRAQTGATLVVEDGDGMALDGESEDEVSVVTISSTSSLEKSEGCAKTGGGAKDGGAKDGGAKGSDSSTLVVDTSTNERCHKEDRQCGQGPPARERTTEKVSTRSSTPKIRKNDVTFPLTPATVEYPELPTDDDGSGDGRDVHIPFPTYRTIKDFEQRHCRERQEANYDLDTDGKVDDSSLLENQSHDAVHPNMISSFACFTGVLRLSGGRGETNSLGPAGGGSHAASAAHDAHRAKVARFASPENNVPQRLSLPSNRRNSTSGRKSYGSIFSKSTLFPSPSFSRDGDRSGSDSDSDEETSLAGSFSSPVIKASGDASDFWGSASDKSAGTASVGMLENLFKGELPLPTGGDEGDDGDSCSRRKTADFNDVSMVFTPPPAAAGFADPGSRRVTAFGTRRKSRAVIRFSCTPESENSSGARLCEPDKASRSNHSAIMLLDNDVRNASCAETEKDIKLQETCDVEDTSRGSCVVC